MTGGGCEHGTAVQFIIICIPKESEMSEMRYEAPKTLEAAVALLSGANGPARVLAGGTDLLIQMRGGRVEPELLVDVKGIPEMTLDRRRKRRVSFRRGRHLHGTGRARGVREGLARRDRRGQADRLDPGEGTRDRGRQSVQRLAGRGQRSRPDRRGRGREHRRAQRQTRGAGRGHRHGTGQDLARQGRDRRLVPAAAAPAAFGRRLSALHAAHRDGHCGRRRRGQSHAG